ncbi:MAG: hypothetical protein NZ992_02450 [Candidatus Korarchaeum sp.]|nr:hypothetical protein [Candidatus Korarchaeum sp.]MDW8036310.1 hypothetical protein [Candidatus Korarchaeum sp.]
MLLLKITAFIAIVIVFSILWWIGYILAIIFPLRSTDEVKREIEEELRNLGAGEGEEIRETSERRDTVY